MEKEINEPGNSEPVDMQELSQAVAEATKKENPKDAGMSTDEYNQLGEVADKLRLPPTATYHIKVPDGLSEAEIVELQLVLYQAASMGGTTEQLQWAADNHTKARELLDKLHSEYEWIDHVVRHTYLTREQAELIWLQADLLEVSKELGAIMISRIQQFYPVAPMHAAMAFKHFLTKHAKAKHNKAHNAANRATNAKRWRRFLVWCHAMQPLRVDYEEKILPAIRCPEQVIQELGTAWLAWDMVRALQGGHAALGAMTAAMTAAAARLSGPELQQLGLTGYEAGRMLREKVQWVYTMNEQYNECKELLPPGEMDKLLDAIKPMADKYHVDIDFVLGRISQWATEGRSPPDIMGLLKSTIKAEGVQHVVCDRQQGGCGRTIALDNPEAAHRHTLASTKETYWLCKACTPLRGKLPTEAPDGQGN